MKDKTISDSIALARDRMLTYQLLSSLYFTEVSVDLLDQLRRNASLPAGKLADYARELSAQDLEGARVDAAADFARLFLGMSAHPVSPYESVFTSPEHLLMQDARDEVLSMYRSEGFAYSVRGNLPEDHIAAEMEFMALLCEKEIEAYENDDSEEVERVSRVQRSFVADHLSAWIPEFCDQVQSRSRTLLYGGLAQITEEFLAAEREFMKIDELDEVPSEESEVRS